MEFKVVLLEETDAELKVFSKKHRLAILNKIRNVAANLPQSLSLKTVQPIRGAPVRETGRLFELDVGSGPRAAFALDNEN